MVEKLLSTLMNLKEVRKQVNALSELGIVLGDIQTGYESVIDDVLELAGLSERQIDLIWEITES